MFVIQYPEIYVNYYTFPYNFLTDYKISYVVNAGATASILDFTYQSTQSKYHAYVMDI